MSTFAPLQGKSTSTNAAAAARKVAPRLVSRTSTGVKPVRVARHEFARRELLQAPGAWQLSQRLAGWDLDAPRASLAPGTTEPRLQTKLEVSEPGDESEREADRAAESVMRMPLEETAPQRQEKANATIHASSSFVQRECASCREGQSEEPERVQRSADGAAELDDGQRAAVWSERFRAARASSGEPLPKSVRQFMEPRFGASFEHVSVHRDETSSSLAKAIGARAFTVGNDVFFKPSEYAPSTERGRRLIAHELAHVVQRETRRASSTSTARSFVQRDTVTLETVEIVGDPHFYDKAKTKNLALSKASPGWPFRADLKSLWAAKEYDDFADTVRNFQVEHMGLSYAQADGILGPKTERALVREASGGAVTSMSANGRHFTKMEETGGKPNAYHNVAGNCLAGYEHLIHGKGMPCSTAELGRSVSDQQAEAWFNADIASKSVQVAHGVAIRQSFLPLTQYQFDALVDIAYEGAFGQALVDAVNSGDDTEVVAIMRKHAGARWGRRANLYEGGDYFW